MTEKTRGPLADLFAKAAMLRSNPPKDMIRGQKFAEFWEQMRAEASKRVQAGLDEKAKQESNKEQIDGSGQ